MHNKSTGYTYAYMHGVHTCMSGVLILDALCIIIVCIYTMGTAGSSTLSKKRKFS